MKKNGSKSLRVAESKGGKYGGTIVVDAGVGETRGVGEKSCLSIIVCSVKR